MQQFFSSDLVLVVFALLLGGLIGMFGERARNERQGNSATSDGKPPEKR